MWMEPESIILSEASQPKKRQIPCDFTHPWNLRNKAKGKKRDEEANQETVLNAREHTDGSRRAGGWGTDETGDGE